MTLEVLRPGALTTVQDLGRRGFRHLGVGVSGALDGYSARVANLLAGNPEGAALLEITLAGPTLRFHVAARIALCGADFDAEVDGQPLSGWRPARLPAGSTLRLGACRRGVRGYLAIGGGVAVDPSLGSRATDLRAGFGGWAGRALRAGDMLPLATGAFTCETLEVARWWTDPAPDLELDREPVLHLMPGHDATVPDAALCRTAWRVSPQSDRQGVRLEGGALALAAREDRVSEPVAPGTVQLPPDGQPIVLLADAQTVGGYPRIGHVASADLARLAQCRPGDSLGFVPLGLEQAQARAAAQRARLARLALAVQARAGA
jgi:biotin-dependent carboxylase-like uncharacterized protein